MRDRERKKEQAEIGREREQRQTVYIRGLRIRNVISFFNVEYYLYKIEIKRFNQPINHQYTKSFNVSIELQ